MVINSKNYKLLIVESESLTSGVNVCQLDICGLDALAWLKSISEECEVVKTVNLSELSDTIVLYSDTPLVNIETLNEICVYMEECGIDSAELVRGYVIGKSFSDCKKVNICSEDFVKLIDSESYAKICKIMRERINLSHMQNGVFMSDPNTVYIDVGVTIGEGTFIAPNNRLVGNTVIGKNCVLESGNFLTDTVIFDGVKLNSVVSVEAKVGEGTTVGPYVYLRPSANVGAHCKVGDFVEIKNSNISDGTKVPHLAYVGDADVGSGVNVGCGVIFANYDGRKKHRTTVGDKTFIGSNTTLIAPIDVGEKVFIAAGATISRSIPDGALVIARARETIKEGRAENYLKRE